MHDGHSDNAAYTHDSRAIKRHYQHDHRADSLCSRYWLLAQQEFEIVKSTFLMQLLLWSVNGPVNQ